MIMCFQVIIWPKSDSRPYSWVSEHKFSVAQFSDLLFIKSSLGRNNSLLKVLCLKLERAAANIVCK